MNLRSIALLLFATPVLALATAAAVRAQSAPQAEDRPGARVDAERVRLFLDRETAGLGGRVEVTVGELDPRLQLAPCARVDLFLPQGSRLWGRSAIGARCVEGATWQVWLPVTVRIFAPALVAARPVATGEPFGEADVRVEEIDLTREPAGVLADPALLRSVVAARPVQPGTPLRADHVRRKPVVAAGDPVRLLYRGEQFQVTSEARALAAAAEGQPVRVQTDSGRVVTGVAQADRTVEIR
jgi:flagella basal body P-ring formation protein FlgA